MLLTALLATALAHSTGNPGATVVLTESTRSELKSTVTQQVMGTLSESTTFVVSKWKMEASVPFTTDQWAKLGEDGTLSVKVGNAVLEQKICTRDGFDAKKHTFAFKLSKPAVAPPVFKYLKKDTDLPPGPPPPEGTRVLFGAGSLEFGNSTLKITLWSSGNTAPSLAGENFVSVSAGAFEGKLPVELTVGDQSAKVELGISGSLKRKDYSNENQGVTGSVVQISLSGKG